MNSVFITGASGLLGLEVVKQLSEDGVSVIGQYYKNKPSNLQNCKWVNGNFKTLNSVRQFLQENNEDITKCNYFINCYGPITYKNIKDLKSEHFKDEMFSNVLVPIEIIGFFLKLKDCRLKSVVNIGFELSGKFIPVKNVLPYIMAKNALLQYSISLADIYKEINFNMISPKSLEGAKIPSKKGETISPYIAAKYIIGTLFGKKSGKNHLI